MEKSQKSNEFLKQHSGSHDLAKSASVRSPDDSAKSFDLLNRPKKKVILDSPEKQAAADAAAASDAVNHKKLKED